MWIGLNALTPPSKHNATQGIQPMLFQCWPASPPLAQHWNSIGWMPRVCWEDCIIFLQICRNTMHTSSHLPRKHKVVHHHVSVSRDLYLCRYCHVIMSLYYSASILCLRDKRDKQFMGDILFLLGPSKHLHKAFNQCCFNVRPASPSLAHHWETNSSNNFHCVCWVHSQRLGYPGGVGDEILLH